MELATRICRTFLFILICATVLIPSRNSEAQGTSGTLPGPINSQQLAVIAERLHLSASQRLSMELAHDDYRHQFRLLREGEIAAFLEEQRKVQGGIPKREVVEKILDEYERINLKIAVLDNTLFDQFLPMLTEQQQSIVPRLRLARERRRYEVQQTMASFGRRTVDLSELFHELDLAQDDFLAADAIIASYEKRMTVIMRKQNKAINRMTLDMMDGLAEQGYIDITQEELLQDPKLLQEVLGHISSIYADLRGKVAEYSDDLRELNMRTYHQVASTIPSIEARHFRNTFYRGTYPRLGLIVAHSEGDWMAKALLLDTLTSEQRDLLRTTSDDYQHQLDLLLATGITSVENFWANFSPFEINQEAADQLASDISELQTRANEINEKMELAVEQQFGAEAVAQIRHEVAEMGNKTTTPVAVESNNALEEDAMYDVIQSYPFSGDRFLPQRINRRDIKRFTQQMQLEGDMSKVLDVLHTDYLERMSSLEILDQLRDARNEARVGSGSEQPSKDKINRVYTLRRQAIETVISTEKSFFEDLRAIVDNDKEQLLNRVGHCRHRRAYAGSVNAQYSLGSDHSNEAVVDVVSLLLEEQPSEETIQRVDNVITQYEENALQAFRNRFEAQLQMQQLADQWTAEITLAAQEDITAVIELQNQYRAVMKQPTSLVQQTDLAIVELNRDTLSQLLIQLPDQLANSLQTAYNHAAYPSIYQDPSRVERQIAAALKLDDLTPSQREQLVNLGSTYLNEYEKFSEEMIDQLSTSSINVVGLEPEAFRAWQEQQQQLAKVKFDRNELNGRAISQLRIILNEEQISRIGGLPEPLGEDDFYFYR